MSEDKTALSNFALRLTVALNGEDVSNFRFFEAEGMSKGSSCSRESLSDSFKPFLASVVHLRRRLEESVESLQTRKAADIGVSKGDGDIQHP